MLKKTTTKQLLRVRNCKSQLIMLECLSNILTLITIVNLLIYAVICYAG